MTARPYKGLESFADTELDAQLFFGRDRERDVGESPGPADREGAGEKRRREDGCEACRQVDPRRRGHTEEAREREGRR